MGVQFTDEQQKVIDLRNRNILVSAAAGSGKTAVLVERIITRLTKDTPPIDVDQLLVVTFTEAAAAEMKERIRNAIEKALDERTDDEHLQRQATLIHHAKVTTIHSFCLSVIRDYFHTIDLDPGFRIGENGEIKLLQQEVVSEVLEEWYETADPDFLHFVESFATGKDDQRIEEIILKLYEYSKSYPNPEAWLSDCVKNYDIPSVPEMEKAPFVRELVWEIQKLAKDVQENMEFAKRLCLEPDGPLPYEATLDSDIKFMTTLQNTTEYAQMQKLISELTWDKLGSTRGGKFSPAKVEMVKDIRDECKKTVKKWKDNYFCDEAENMLSGMNAAKADMEVLIGLVRAFAKLFAEKKQNKNMIDFSDMEHYALQILTREENGKLVPSPVAQAYQEKFEEIMIDEYQDSNYVQEAILTSVSTVSDGKYNVFMVGDVKQSIYRFRLARPELFMEKYNTYSEQDAKQQKIDLYHNFRSRIEVLDSTNFIFRQIMTKGFGGIEYDDKAALHVGDGKKYDSRPGNETEILLIDTSEEIEDLTSRETEALVVADRIKKLVGHHEILDKKTGKYRKAEYRDIVVLTRAIKGWTDVFQRILREEGVPAYSVSKEGYFDAREVRMILDYLRVLDNPRQDIPFTAVLCSPFAGVTADELTVIKGEMENGTFYERTLSYVENGTDVKLKEKLQSFMEQLEGFRGKVPYTAIHQLLWEILDQTGYGNYTASLPAGDQRTANLEMLVEKAISFESTSYKGLFHFVRYIEQLEKYDVDYGEANIQDESSDVVTLMSIHKSKGLEFPIVIVSGMNKEFNLRDTSDSVVLHSELGAGIDFIDVESREKSPSLLKSIIKQKAKNESVAEELRILYVAMTRAKEKLILTGTVKDTKERLANCRSLAYHQEEALPYMLLTGARKYFDWVIPALYRNQAFSPLLNSFELENPWQNPLYKEKVPIVVSHVRAEDLMKAALEEEIKDKPTRQILQNWKTDVVYDEKMKEHIEEQFSFSYPYEKEAGTKQKVSVSELKKRAYLEEEEIEEEVVIPLLPKFASQETNLTGASRGTAYHRVLELLDFSKEYDIEMMKETIEKMVEGSYLTAEMAACVNASDILTFTNSPVGRRMQEAYRKNLFHAEQPFVLGDEKEDSEMILVQGIIDVYFEEDGELVVLDYKTDKVSKTEELKERYQLQLDYYAKVLAQVTGKRVKEKIIYSFTLQEEIEV